MVSVSRFLAGCYRRAAIPIAQSYAAACPTELDGSRWIGRHPPAGAVMTPKAMAIPRQSRRRLPALPIMRLDTRPETSEVLLEWLTL